MRKSSFVIIAFAASVALVACDDSSSASGDDVPGSSDSGAALGSSGSVPAGWEGLPDDVVAHYWMLTTCGEDFYPEGSCNSITGADGKVYQFECVGTKWEYNQDCEEPMCLTVVSQMQHPECQFPECNADSEGLVHERIVGFSRYGYGLDFYKCEQGEWHKTVASVTCDTAGVAVGEICKVLTSRRSLTPDWYTCYKYLGNGAWDDGVDCSEEQEGETAPSDSTDEQ